MRFLIIILLNVAIAVVFEIAWKKHIEPWYDTMCAKLRAILGKRLNAVKRHVA